MPRRVPGSGPGLRWVAAVAMLALPLAGCLDTVPPDLPSGDPAPPARQDAPSLPAPAPILGLRGEQDDGASTNCLSEPQRSEETELRQVIVTVQGCAAVVEPVFTTNLPDDMRIAFATRAGAQHLLVMFQLQGNERASAMLGGPWPYLRQGFSDEGNEDRNTLVRFEVAQPPAGSWDLRGWIDDLAVARQWTTTIVVTY